MKFLVVVSIDVSARKHLLDMGKEFRVDGHHILEMPVNRTVLNHPDLSITFDNLGLDLADLLINKDGDIFLTAQNLFTSFNNAVGAKGVGCSRPTKCWLAFLPGFQQRLV